MDSRSPAQGTLDDMLDRLTAYVDPILPAWRVSIRGATDRDLLEFVRAAGLGDAARIDALPASYRRWAAVAGLDDGGLLTHSLRAWVTLPELIKFYADLHRFEPEYVCQSFPCVIKRKIGDEISFDLRLPSPNPELLETSSSHVIGSSWEAILFQCATSVCERARFTSAAFFGATTNEVRGAMARASQPTPDALVSTMATAIGLELAWYNDARHVYGFGPDITAMFDIDIGNTLTLAVVGANSKMVRELAQTLADTSNARPVALDRWR